MMMSCVCSVYPKVALHDPCFVGNARKCTIGECNSVTCLRRVGSILL